MGLFSKDIKTMDDLFVHGLRDIYYAEKQIAKALPKMAAKASDAQLRQAFETHVSETKNQIRRVEEVFRMHGLEVKGTTWATIDGIIEETQDMMGDVADPEVLDAALIGAEQAVEHYEITRYGTLAAWAKELGRADCAQALHAILEEERSRDEWLTKIAESRINRKAA